MKSFFWFLVGMASGAALYRSYSANGGRLPFVDDLLRRNGQPPVSVQAEAAVEKAKAKGEEMATGAIAATTTEAVKAVAREITEAEEAKRQEEVRQELP